MPNLPARDQQIVTMHAAFICRVVELGQNPAARTELESILKSAADNGWVDLVGAVRSILQGRRDSGVLRGLDEEDAAIAQAILRGLQDPATLPAPDTKVDSTLAAPGLAEMIRAAGSGNAEALQIVANLAEQMSRAGGAMARLAAAIRPLINGERDPAKLCNGMDPKTEQLLIAILEELGKSSLH